MKNTLSSFICSNLFLNMKHYLHTTHLNTTLCASALSLTTETQQNPQHHNNAGQGTIVGDVRRERERERERERDKKLQQSLLGARLDMVMKTIPGHISAGCCSGRRERGRDRGGQIGSNSMSNIESSEGFNDSNST